MNFWKRNHVPILAMFGPSELRVWVVNAFSWAQQKVSEFRREGLLHEEPTLPYIHTHVKHPGQWWFLRLSDLSHLQPEKGNDILIMLSMIHTALFAYWGLVGEKAILHKDYVVIQFPYSVPITSKLGPIEVSLCLAAVLGVTC